MSTWRKCLNCGEVKEKASNFSAEEWKCNACVTGINVSSPSVSNYSPSGGIASKYASASTYSPSTYTTSSPVRTGSFSGSLSSGGSFRKGSMGSMKQPDDREQYQKLFWNIDEDRSGSISKAEMKEKMVKMLGTFNWEDKNNDGYVNFDEFANIMESLEASVRYSAISWARQCLASDGLLKSKSAMRRIQSMKASSPIKKSTEEERAIWRKLFNYVDEDKTGSIERMELEEKLAKMLGKFEFTDQDNSGSMSFEEFVETMDKLNASTRYSALSWARQCL